MKVEWSPITRIKEKFGIIKYKAWFGNTFEQLLDENKIDYVLDIIKTTKAFDDDEYFRTVLIKHVETYKYSC